MTFLDESFLLHTLTARTLYQKFAAGQPIFDYHCHLSPKDIADDRQFANLFELWLDGDHYKWRAMRANGVDENFVTGSATPRDKFQAWARTVPYTLRNPLYHWSHLELKRYFGIDTVLNESTAQDVWDRTNEMLGFGELTAQKILLKFDVKVVCTTDDPVDTLEHHARIAARPFGTRVLPTYRPDRVLQTANVEQFNEYLDLLGSAANISIVTIADLLEALDRRHAYFHSMSCRLSDHGLEQCFADFPAEAEASAIFDTLRTRREITPLQSDRFASHLMVFLAELDAKRGWTKQLHLGALRNTNSAMLSRLGRDTGFDSIGDLPQASHLAAYLNRLTERDALPRLILYNLNPADNYVFATMAGNFQDSSVPGKIQFGSGWWFLDQKEGVEWQLNTLSHAGLLSRFVGMLTDSRSFMSFPRHEYFRRVLCNLLGTDIERGELPNDESLIGSIIENICFGNASRYFEIDY